MTLPAAKSPLTKLPYLFIVAVLGWWIPGGGHFAVGLRTKAIIIFCGIAFAFIAGIYIGSIAVIDAHTPWYWAQLLNTPAVAYLAHIVQVQHLNSVGRPREIGEIYTGIAGMLNLLCVVNAVYLAHCRLTGKDKN
jgi:hypothetical protein